MSNPLHWGFRAQRKNRELPNVDQRNRGAMRSQTIPNTDPQ